MSDAASLDGSVTSSYLVGVEVTWAAARLRGEPQSGHVLQTALPDKPVYAR